MTSTWIRSAGLVFAILFTGCENESSPSEAGCICDEPARFNLCVTLDGGQPDTATRDPVVYDDFGRASPGFLRESISPMGQPWACSGPAYLTARIFNGMFVADSNVYCYLDYGKLINRIAGTYSIVRGNGDNDTQSHMLTLIADQEKIGLNTMLHLTLGPVGWNLVKRVNGGPFVPLAAHSYTRMIRTDGSKYSVAMTIRAGSVSVLGADSVLTVVADADIGGLIKARYGGWQIFPNIHRFTGRWHTASMGYSMKTIPGSLSFMRERADGSIDLLTSGHGGCFAEHVGLQRLYMSRGGSPLDSSEWFNVRKADCCHGEAKTVDFIR